MAFSGFPAQESAGTGFVAAHPAGLNGPGAGGVAIQRDGVHSHHNSEDRPEMADARSLRDLTGDHHGVPVLHCVGGRGGRALAGGVMQAHWKREIAAAKDAGEAGYRREIAERAMRSLARIAPGVPMDGWIAGLGPRAEAPAAPKLGMVVRRKRPGTLPLDDLPKDQWEGFPSGAWDKPVTVALYWCDGKRDLGEVIRLTEREVGPVKMDWVGYFRFLERRGYVEVVR